MPKEVAAIIPLNSKQKQFLLSPAKYKALIAGRGFGKTHTLGHRQFQLAQNLPSGKSLIVAPTFGQLLTKTMPEVEAVWHSLNLFEWDPKRKTGHYVFGKKPPGHWAKPLKGPKKYEYAYSFINGHVKELASLEQNDHARGGSFDSLDGDESALFKEEVWNKIFVNSVRGRLVGKDRWDPVKNYLSGSICHYTSAPWRTEGKWIWKWRELMERNPKDYLLVSGTTLDNINILGEEYIERLRQNLSPLEFYIEVLNGELKRQAGGGFYPAFNEERHTTLTTFEYDWDTNGRMTIKRDSFIDAQKFFMLSMDFNVSFTSMIVCQQIQHPSFQEFRICDNVFVKPDPIKDKEGEMLIDTLVDEFCHKYAAHPIKYIELYGDASANNRRIGAPPMFEQAKARFRHHGWSAVIKAAGKLPGHEQRHILINNILSRRDSSYPVLMINANNCKATILSITNAPITKDFKKDKRSETQNIDQELATHLSDCVDYILCSLYSRLINGDSGELWSTFMPGR